MKPVLVIAAILLSGCATSTRFEVEHISHPTDGWPSEKQSGSEDDVTQANVIMRWQKEGWYMDAGLGVNLQGEGGGGFYGSALTGTVRAGYEVVWK